MENGGEPSLKKVKTEPADDTDAHPGSSPLPQTRLIIDPQRVQHLQEIAKQFDSKHSKKTTSFNIQESGKEQETSLKNSKPGKGSSLETIIGRLNPETGAEAKGAESTEATGAGGAAGAGTSKGKDSKKLTMDRKEVATQTAVSMVQLIKSIIRDRMKALQDSVFKDAAVDNLMNGRLIELRKENKELKECLEKLQAKYDSLLKQSTLVRKPETNRRPQTQSLRPEKTPVDVGKTTDTKASTFAPSIVQTTTTMAVAAVATASASAPVPVPVSAVSTQPGGFILLQNKPTIPRTKPNILLPVTPAGGGRPTVTTLSPATVSHRPIPHRGQPQVQQQPPSQIVQQPPPPQQMQMLVNVQSSQINSQGPILNMHGHPVNPSVVPPGQLIGGQVQMMNAAGQIVNSKGQPVTPISPQVRPAGHIRYGVPQFIGPTSQPSIRPSASTQVVFASQGVRVTTDPRMTSLPPNYEQATGGQSMHYSHSAVPRPRMAQPPPNFVMQSPPGHMPVVTPQQTRKPDVIQSSNSNSIGGHVVDSLPKPPRLQVTISAAGSGIVLSWDVEAPIPANMPSIECYHLFAYQDSEFPPRAAHAWKRIGVVKALPLPMACTLTQFVSGSSYHFAITAVDMYGRQGPMSNSCTIRLGK